MDARFPSKFYSSYWAANKQGSPLLELMAAQSLASDCLIRSLMGMVYFKYPIIRTVIKNHT